ncbi:MAG: hypothetical protein ACRCXZ_04900 [Patescibacteria group bacterium]
MCQAQSYLTAEQTVQIATLIQPGVYPIKTFDGSNDIIRVNQLSVAHTYSIKVGKAYEEDKNEVVCFTLPILGSKFESIQVLPNSGIEKEFNPLFQTLLDYTGRGAKGLSTNSSLTQIAEDTFIVVARNVHFMLEQLNSLSQKSKTLASQLVQSHRDYLRTNATSGIMQLPVIVYLQDTSKNKEDLSRCFVSYLTPFKDLITFASSENNHTTLEIPKYVDLMDCFFVWGHNSLPSTVTKTHTRDEIVEDWVNPELYSAIVIPEVATNWFLPQYITGFVHIEEEDFENSFVTVNPFMEENNLKQFSRGYKAVQKVLISDI